MSRATSSLFEQLPLDEMEMGLVVPIATTLVEPAEISQRLGITFESGRDDLDALEAALLRTPSGRQFALVRHQHQPASGTDILTNEKSGDFAQDLKESLAMLRMTRKDLGWVHPDAVEDHRIRRVRQFSKQG
jgi:hypothetical protein